MNVAAQYAKGSVTGQVVGNNNHITSVTRLYATRIGNNETYRQAVLRLAAAATRHFITNNNTGGRRPTFRETAGGPFQNPGNAIRV